MRAFPRPTLRMGRPSALAALAALAVVLAGCDSNVLRPGGNDSQDYITTKYAHWVIEVDAASDNAPSQGLLDSLRDRLSPLVNPTVDFVRDEKLATGDREWTTQQVLDFAAEHQGRKTGGDTVALHLLFLDGHYATAGVLGVTIGHDVIAIFPQTIQSNCQPISLNPCTYSYDQIALPVTLHELGHALGLVNNGTPMVRNHEAATCDTGSGAKPNHGHSSNRNSVMYCAVEEGFSITAIFGQGDIPNTFDSDDRADIHAAGGK